MLKRAGGLKEVAFVDGVIFTRSGMRIAGNYDKIFFGRKRYDIELAAGDDIFIPGRPGVISVEGAVNNQSLIKFQKGWSVSDYIDVAGGYHRNADQREVVSHYASGDAKEKGWLFGPKIKDGCRIFVALEKEKEDIDWTELLKETASIAASLATIWFIIDRSG